MTRCPACIVAWEHDVDKEYDVNLLHDLAGSGVGLALLRRVAVLLKPKAAGR